MTTDRQLMGSKMAGRGLLGTDADTVTVGNVPVAELALALIRLDRSGEADSPACTFLVRLLLERQESDGGWGDHLSTALCVAALSCGRGRGISVEAGLAYLAGHEDPGAGSIAVPFTSRWR